MSKAEFDPLDEVSVTLAQLCFFNNKEVEQVFETFKKFSDAETKEMDIERFQRLIGINNKAIAKYFECYIHLKWNNFFQFFLINTYAPSEIMVKCYFLYLGVNYDNPIEECQLTTLLEVTSKIGYLQDPVFKKEISFPTDFTTVMQYLETHRDCVLSLLWFRDHVKHCVFTDDLSYDISSRRQRMSNYMKYRNEHLGKIPTENCCDQLKRTMKKLPPLYQHDYEIHYSSIKDQVDSLLNKYKMMFLLQPIQKHEIPIFESLKRDGDTLSMNKYRVELSAKCQPANRPSRPRSLVASHLSSEEGSIVQTVISTNSVSKPSRNNSLQCVYKPLLVTNISFTNNINLNKNIFPTRPLYSPSTITESNVSHSYIPIPGAIDEFSPKS